MFVGRNAFAPVTERSAATVSVAEAFCGLVPCDELTAPDGIVLMYTPGAGDTTVTCIEHWPATPAAAAGIVPPENDKEPLPGVAVTEPPTHVVEAFAGFATTTLPGSVSVNATAVAGAEFELSRMTVSVDVCPAETLVGANVLLSPTDANAAVGASAVATSSVRNKYARAMRGTGERRLRFKGFPVLMTAMPLRNEHPLESAGST